MIKRTRNRTLFAGMILLIFLPLYFDVVLHFMTKETDRLYITALLFPFSLLAIKYIMGEFFNSNNPYKILSEAKLYRDEGVISPNEYNAIKLEIRGELEQRKYVNEYKCKGKK